MIKLVQSNEPTVNPSDQEAGARIGPVFMIDSVGAQRGMHYYNFPYSEALYRAGVDVRLLSTTETVNHDLRPLDVPTAPAFQGVYGGLLKPLRGINYVASLFRIARMARRYRAAIAHFHFYQIPLADERLVAWLNDRSIFTVATIHDILPFALGEDVRSGRGSTLHRIYRRLSGIIVNSRHAFSALQELDADLAKKAVVIPHGNFSAYTRARSVPQPEARARLDLPQHDPLILIFGTLKPNKRLDLVIQALPRIVQAHPDVRLVVAGKPRNVDVSKLKTLADSTGMCEHVIWRLGFIDDADAPHYFCAADIALFPYQWIYQSGALLMAMSFGKPVAATDVGSNPEFVCHDRTGLLVPGDSETAMAEAILRLLDEPDHAAAMGRAAAHFVERELSWDRIAQLTKSFYSGLSALSGGTA